MSALQYLVVSTLCISVTYIIFRIISRNETNFRLMRVYLLASIAIAVLMPLNSYRINIDVFEKQYINEAKNYSITSLDNGEIKPQIFGNAIVNSNIRHSNVNWWLLIKWFYFIVCVLLLFNIVYQVITLCIVALKSEREKQGNYLIINNKKYKSTFSFFNLIFTNSDQILPNEKAQILSHEKIHASQYHSIDLIMIELLAAVMWFNPLVWMMRNSMQLVHEYLADEGALSTGIDKLKYQALLINQVTEERLICLSSSFNHSLIKKRMIMMTKSKFNQQAKLKFLALIPVVAILFIGVACFNGKSKQGTNDTISTTPPIPPPNSPPPPPLPKVFLKNNFVYKFAYNPINVELTGDFEITADQGEIKKQNGEYFIIPSKDGALTITTKQNGNESSQKFQAVTLPSANSFEVGGKVMSIGNKITLSELKANRELHVSYNEGLKPIFDVVEFRIFFNQGKSDEEVFYISGNKLSDKDIALILTGFKKGKVVVLDHLKLNFPDNKSMYHGCYTIENK